MDLVIVSSLFLAYVIAFCIHHKGIPDSLYGQVMDLEGLCRIMWTIVVTLMSVMLGIFFISNSSNLALMLAIVASVVSLATAVIPLDKKSHFIHHKDFKIASIVAAASSQATVLANKPLLLLACWTPWTLLYLLNKTIHYRWNKKEFFIEITCWIAVIVYCFSLI